MYLTDITIGQSLLYSVVAIAGVFLILLIIVFCINILSLIKFNDDGTLKNKKQETSVPATNASSVDKALVEGDDDMMAAVLVASIDFYNETKQNARCVSVKQIN